MNEKNMNKLCVGSCIDISIIGIYLWILIIFALLIKCILG